MKNFKNIEVSFRSGFNQPIRSVNLFKFLTTDYYNPLLNDIRNEEDKEVRQELKKNLGAITPSGIFKHSMKNENLIEHSELLCLDLDDDNIYTAESMKDVVSKLEQVVFCSLSASGKGVFALIWIDPEKHLSSFLYCQQFFKENLDLIIDQQCKNVARLRFASNDEDYYINLNATKLDVTDWEMERERKMIEAERNRQDRLKNDGDYDDFSQYCKSFEADFVNGNRNRWLYLKAGQGRNKFGLSKAEVESVLLKYATDGVPESEVRTAVRSAFNN